MQKSVYSLVLMDDVVAAIDRIAAREGTSRSNMINRILAEYTQMTTPEQYIRSIFDAVNAVLGTQSVLQPMLASSTDAMLTLRSALQYKYNPSVRYSVELYRSAGEEMGELRAQLRTQSPALILYLAQFFRLWAKLEAAYLPGPQRSYDIADGRFSRRLRTPCDTTPEQAGEAIANYVRLFDACLKTYFDNLSSPEAAVRAVENVYAKNLDAVTAQL